jgi:hypothetical protein
LIAGLIYLRACFIALEVEKPIHRLVLVLSYTPHRAGGFRSGPLVRRWGFFLLVSCGFVVFCRFSVFVCQFFIYIFENRIFSILRFFKFELFRFGYFSIFKYFPIWIFIIIFEKRLLVFRFEHFKI